VQSLASRWAHPKLVQPPAANPAQLESVQLALVHSRVARWAPLALVPLPAAK
jgi:hypothetical protein